MELGYSVKTVLIFDPRNLPLHAYVVMLGTIFSYPPISQSPHYRLVAQFITHPSYKDEHSGGDIALVQLTSPVNFSELILPVCLPKPGDPLGHGTWCWVTGWGNINMNQGKDIQSSWWATGSGSCGVDPS